MAVQVIQGEDKQQVRTHDSILLGRKAKVRHLLGHECVQSLQGSSQGPLYATC
jgi:hypothetical protein